MFDKRVINDNIVCNERNQVVTAELINPCLNENNASVCKNDFYIGALKEMKDISSFVFKPLSKELFLKMLSEETAENAKSCVNKFLDSISDSDSNDYIESPAIKEFLRNAPIFKIMFLDNLNSELGSVLKAYLNNDNSREQHMLYTMMEMSYFGQCKTAQSALDNINQDLQFSGFEKLNSSKTFDKLVINCIKEEEMINQKYGLDCKIGGMRTIAKLMAM